MYHPFSVTETINNAWAVLKKNVAVVAVYTLITIIIAIASFFVIYGLVTDDLMKTIGVLLLLVEISFIFLGFMKLIFTLIDKAYYDFEFKDIVPKLKVLGSYLLLLFIVSTLAFFMARLVYLMNEGILQNILDKFVYWFFQFFFLFYFPICACFIVDDDSGPFESVIQSFNLIRGNFFKYLILFLLIEGMVFVGAFTVIGMIFVMPFVNIVLIVAYRKLIYSHQDVDDDVSETV